MSQPFAKEVAYMSANIYKRPTVPPMRFYVYAFLLEDFITPDYIGKGSGKRAWKKRGHDDVQRPSDNCRIIILQDNMSESDAYSLEIERIDFYGRIDLGTEILRNRTNGGGGTSGWICSQETRAKLSEAKTGRSLSQEHRLKLSEALAGRTPSQESRVRMSAAGRGKNVSQEHRDRISAANTGKKHSQERIAKRIETRRKNKEARSHSDH